MATAQDVDGVDPRTRRAAEEYLVTVNHAPGMFRVYSHDGEPRTVDLIERACTCGDFQYRQPDGGCKHIRRVLMAIGELPIPPGVDTDRVLKKRRDESV